MTKKQRKRSRGQTSFPWVLLVIGGILVALAALLWANSRSNRDVAGTPVISVDPSSIDYGDVPLGTNKTFAVSVTNTGTGTLRFEEEPYIEVVEGC